MDDQALEPWRSRKRLRGQRPRGQCPSSAMDDYDVFLNHRGPDVKAGFMAHLDEALRSAGLNPFLDKTSLKKGHPAFRSIDAALKVAKVHVAVVSKGYADSKYCLSELVAMMKSGKPVIPVFYDVEPAHLRWVESGPFAVAFEKHKSKKSPQQVEKWRDALRKLAEITGFYFRFSDYKGDEAELKRQVVDAVLSLTPTFEALHVEHQPLGVEEQVDTCINKLKKMSSATCLLGLVGMGGIGKTALAKEIYNQFVGCKEFQAMSFLEVDRNIPSSTEVGPSLLSGLQKQLLWDLLHVPANNMQSYKYWFYKLSSQGRVLVVVDNIHHKAQFDKLILNPNLLAPGSCIIVTCRDRHILKVIGGESHFYLHEVTPLGIDDSQKLFNLHAFRNEEVPEKFKTFASDVSKACGGLPLALKVVGSSLFDKKSDEDLEYIWPEAIDALKGDVDVVRALKWSYDCLSEPEKLMFVDIACLFHGWKKEEALEIWKSCKKCSSCCGCRTPYTTLRQLLDKSLVVLEYSRVEPTILGMHDLLRDLGQSIGMVDGSHLSEGKATKVIEYKSQGTNKVRALNLTNSWKDRFDTMNFAKMTNLHFLILDGCDVIGDLGGMFNELRWLQWRYMPLMHLPFTLDLSNLISLDLSYSTKLASIWAKSDPALEACPNLLRLDMGHCTSITTLPDSIGCLSRLEVLNLGDCKNLEQLPSSIGQLTSLQELTLIRCERLEMLPDTITALSGLRKLYMQGCSTISKLPTTIRLMIGLKNLYIDLATEWQAIFLGECNALDSLVVTFSNDEVITLLDRLGTLSNLDKLSNFWFLGSASMTKLPETIGLLTNLNYLELHNCWKLQELPHSIGQLKMLTGLFLCKCYFLETLPDSLGELTGLVSLWIVECFSITKLPPFIGHLPKLRQLRIEACIKLEALSVSLKQLTALEFLTIMACGTLEDLGVLRVLQGLRIWGCMSITELPGSCLIVSDSNTWDPAWLWDLEEFLGPRRRGLKEVRVVEETDCGFLRFVEEETQSGLLILQRVYNLPCYKWTKCIHLNIHLASVWQTFGIGQLNARKKLKLTECIDEAIAIVDSSGILRNLDQLSSLWFYECSSMTKLPQTVGLLTNLHYLHIFDCENVLELPNSIGQLKVFRGLSIRKCRSLETLPDSLGALTSLQDLWIAKCTSITKLPTSICRLSSLRQLRIEGCSGLQVLPDSLKQLNTLEFLTVTDCGNLEDLNALRVLQGLRIWGCTSVIELPGSCLMVLDGNTWNPARFWDLENQTPVCRKLKEVQVVEATDCGFLRFVQEDIECGRLILQRVYKLPCLQQQDTELQFCNKNELSATEM